MSTIGKITTKDKEEYINKRNEREIEQIKEAESRIDQDKLEIKDILDFINNDSLSRSHNSVNISFSQMLAYVDKIRKPIQDADIITLYA
jgi:Na+/phosphate symporter